MALEAFSPAWAEAWARELNESEAYRSTAASWEGAVALVLDDGNSEGRRAVVLDLWHGHCRSGRTADPDRLDEAVYVFQGNLAGWKQVLTEGGSPVMALMAGRIRLIKGSLAALLPYASAAKALLELAGRVPTEFAEG